MYNFAHLNRYGYGIILKKINIIANQCNSLTVVANQCSCFNIIANQCNSYNRTRSVSYKWRKPVFDCTKLHAIINTIDLMAKRR